MDRIINIKVGGNYLSKDNKNAGVRGEGNVTNLRITYDKGWDGYSKTVTFWDAQGKNPVKRIQGIDLLEDSTKDLSTYITPIPPEAMAIAGELTFVIDGYAVGKRQRTIADKLVVKDSPITENAKEPTDPTPTEPEQWQEQIDAIKEDIQKGIIASNDAMLYRDEATSASDSAASYRDEAVEKANESKAYAERAEASIGKTSYIGDNGNWFSWDGVKEEFYDTGVKAQSGSTVYTGNNPPPEADVWIDPNETAYEPFVPVITIDTQLEEFSYGDYTKDGVYVFVFQDGDIYDIHTLKVWWEFDILYQVVDNKHRREFQYEWSEWETFNVDFTPDEKNKVAKIDGVIRELGNKASMEDVCEYIDEQTEIIKTDVEGLQKQLNEEAHFKGYLSTNAKIQALDATPNDFAYSAESGTKWIYDEVNGWQDSNTPVPDQLTPASESTPLINGDASVGTENAYARGDHRHPTDTTRASVEELHRVERYAETLEEEIVGIWGVIGNIDTVLDNIIEIQNSLIGGDA